MTPNQIGISVLMLATLVPFCLVFIKLDELLIWIGIAVVCTWTKLKAKF